MTDDNAISAGRDAWMQIERSNSFESWKAISIAVSIGRQEAMRAAGINKPWGKRYSKALNVWLEANGLCGMPYALRTGCCRLVDHLREIELWRATTPGAERWNHPQVLVRRWRRDFAPGRLVQNRTAVHTVTSAKRGALVANPDQDTIRRIAAELRENWTTDVYRLALIAYHAVMRPAPPPPKPAREMPADDVAHEAA